MGRFADVVVKFAVSFDLPEEESDSGEAHPEDGGHSQLDFFSYLVLLSDQRHEFRIWEDFELLDC